MHFMLCKLLSTRLHILQVIHTSCSFARENVLRCFCKIFNYFSYCFLQEYCGHFLTLYMTRILFLRMLLSNGMRAKTLQKWLAKVQLAPRCSNSSHGYKMQMTKLAIVKVCKSLGNSVVQNISTYNISRIIDDDEWIMSAQEVITCIIFWTMICALYFYETTFDKIINSSIKGSYTRGFQCSL